MDLAPLSHHVDEPALGDPSARVEAELVFAVGAIGGLRNLDDEHGTRRVRVPIGVRIVWYDADVGLCDLLSVSERRAEGVQHLADGPGVPAALRLANDERGPAARAARR